MTVPELAKLTLAPLALIVNVTDALGTGLPLESVARTCRSVAKSLATVVVWLLPAEMVRDVGTPETTV